MIAALSRGQSITLSQAAVHLRQQCRWEHGSIGSIRRRWAAATLQPARATSRVQAQSCGPGALRGVVLVGRLVVGRRRRQQRLHDLRKSPQTCCVMFESVFFLL